MKVSIVTPTYNAAAFLSKTLDSVLEQTLTDWEHIIVDDCSSDGTVAIAQSYADHDPRIRIFRKDHGGVAEARNFGYSWTDPQSDFLIFLDHDDCWKPHTLERLAQALIDNPTMAAAHGLACMTDLEGNSIEDTSALAISHNRRKIVPNNDRYSIEFCDRDEPTNFVSMICNCGVPTPGLILLRRSTFESIKEDYGYFDPSVGSGNDWDAWIRLTLRGPMAAIDEILLDWRQHPNNGTNDTTETRDADHKVRTKMMSLPILSPNQRAMARWRYQTIYGPLSVADIAQSHISEPSTALHHGPT